MEDGRSWLESTMAAWRRRRELGTLDGNGGKG
jgi:hypothetical protein